MKKIRSKLSLQKLGGKGNEQRAKRKRKRETETWRHNLLTEPSK